MRRSWPFFSEEEIQAVTAVLNSGNVNYWTGEQGRLFEEEFASAVGCDHAIAVANGTIAIEYALNALGIGPGDEVITTSRTFVATASSVVLQGATPVFADVDPISQNITVESIKSVVTPKTKAIIVVHLAGWPCQMDEIMKFARKNSLYVIEDCAQAHGAAYKGKSVGSYGDIGTFSFCQDKIMTTGGEGGMIVTNDNKLWKKMWSYKDHGKDYDLAHHKQHSIGFRWLHENFGTNGRITEMQAAIGRIQLKKLSEWVKKRRHYAAIYNEAFSGHPAFRVTIPDAQCYHSYYKYYVFLQKDFFEDRSRDELIQCLAEKGVACFSGICSEIYLENCFKKSGLTPSKNLPIAKQLGETSLVFLVHPTLKEEEIYRVIEAVLSVVDTRVHQ